MLRLLCKYESSSDSLLAGICRHGLGLDLHPSPLNPNLRDVAIFKVRQIPIPQCDGGRPGEHSAFSAKENGH